MTREQPKVPVLLRTFGATFGAKVNSSSRIELSKITCD